MKQDNDVFIRKVKGLAERTKELYAEHLNLFAEWCAREGVNAWDAVTADLVERYLDGRESWGDSMRWSGLCAIRRFARWKFGENHPILELTRERASSPPQRTLNKKTAGILLSLFDTTKPKGIRDLAICSLAMDTGLRAEELVSIQLAHLDMDERVLFVPVKGGEWEPAAFFEYSASCLARWLGARETLAKSGVTTLFVSIGGIKRGEPLTRDGLRAIFRAFSKDSELGLISPHDLRRTFATLAAENGAPDRVIMTAGRWKSQKMVILYTRALKAKAMHRYSPVNQLMGVSPENGRE